TSPPNLLNVAKVLANQRRQAQLGLGEAEAMLARLRQPPLFPADVVGGNGDGRLEVVVGGRRQVVVRAPELADLQLQTGDEVLLDAGLTAAVARNEHPRRSGVVGTISESRDGRVLLRGLNDQEFTPYCCPELARELDAGDRVVYKPESQLVVARLPKRTRSAWALEPPPRVTFADIGGLDAVIDEIRRDLDLHLSRSEVARAYGLRLMRGMVLVGPPGGGKTLTAGAIASYLRERDAATRFLHVKPGGIRGSFYGESESRIREVFSVARAAPGLCVVFFDELDALAARGTGIGQDIDGRVLGSLLAELNGLESEGKILAVGATNRLDLCDPALVRAGRFGDRVYTISRPNREAARDIFSKYLTADLPYWPRGDETRTNLIEAAVAHLYAARGGAGPVATVTFLNGERREVEPRDVVCGALVATAVERAKHAAAERHTEEDGGLRVEDLLEALDEALVAEAKKLRSPVAARHVLDFPRAEEIARVELPARRRPGRHRYLRAASA
ncbi:MAG: AAA family ATPase, partial [Candidatus Binatia bacterium]